MTSDAARYVWNTRERLTSTGLNRTQDLLHRLILELNANSIAATDTGVINGLTLSMPNTTTVEIAPGVAHVFDATVVYPDSKKRLVEVDTTISVGLSAASGVNNRWDGIFISPRSTALPDVAVDIFDPATGTFSSQLKTKETENDALITIVEGAVAASPAIPANPGGSPPKIPLGYIYRPVGGGGATTTMLFGARPIMGHVVSDAAAATTIRDAQFIRGGGVRVNPDFTVRPENCVGSFSETGIIFTIGTNCIVDFTDAEYRDQDTLAALPVVDTVIYWYSHPAPIPIQGAQSEYVPGVDAIALLPGISTSQENCMILASTRAPNNDVAQGIPSADLRSITTVFGNVVIDRDSCVYLGATDYNFDELEMNLQKLTNGGHVYRQDVHHPSTTWGLATGAGQIDIWAGSGVVADQGLLPETATRVYCLNKMGLASSTGLVKRAINDERGPAVGAPTLYYEKNTSDIYDIDVELIYYPNSSGEIELFAAISSGTPATNLILHSVAYDDVILGRR